MKTFPNRTREVGDARRYSADAHGLHHALTSLLDDYPLPREVRFGCYRLRGENRYADIARQVECDVFEEFFGNAADIMAHQYGRYEEASEFLLVIDRQMGKAVGALRIIHDSTAGFKTLNDIAGPPLCISTEAVQRHYAIEDWTRCWDVATVAVTAEHRGDLAGQVVSTALYGHVYALALQSGIEHLIAILDAHAYRQLSQALSIPFAPILGSPPFNYLGSESSRATHVRVSDIRPSMEQRLRNVDDQTRSVLTPIYRNLLHGEKLPPLVEVKDD